MLFCFSLSLKSNGSQKLAAFGKKPLALQLVPPWKPGHGVSKDNFLKKKKFFSFKMPKLAGVFIKDTIDHPCQSS